MSTVAAPQRGTDALAPVADGIGRDWKIVVAQTAARWLFDKPAIVVLLLVMAVGIPGYVPGYFEGERQERAAIRAEYAAAGKAEREAQAAREKLARDDCRETMQMLVLEITKPFDRCTDELRRLNDELRRINAH